MTGPSSADEFYIGYDERMPPGFAVQVRRAVAMFAVVAAAGAAVALGAQQILPASRFEFGVVRPVTGTLRHAPYPVLQVAGEHVWLVGRGKRGAEDLVNGTPDGRVTVEGSAIRRGGTRLFEVHRVMAPDDVGASAARSNDAIGPAPASDPVRLTGEIVDSKCFTGVMNPGEGTVHRDCARRCLSGGIPPMLVVRDGAGREELVLLVSADGRPIGRELAPIAGLPVSVEGRLARDGAQYVLFADARAYRRAAAQP